MVGLIIKRTTHMEGQVVLVEAAEEVPRGVILEVVSLSPSFLPALRDKQVYMGVREVRGKLCPLGKEVVMVEVEVEVEAWEERYLLSQVM